MARTTKWDRINRRKAGAKKVYHDIYGDLLPSRGQKGSITQQQELQMFLIERRTGRRFIGTTFDHAKAYIELNGRGKYSRKVALANPKADVQPKVKASKVSQRATPEVQADESPKLKSGEPGVYALPNGRWRAIYVENGKQTYLGSFDTVPEAVEAREIYIELLDDEPSM